MIDNAAKIVLLSAFVILVICSMIYAVKEYKLLKSRIESENDCRDVICQSVQHIEHLLAEKTCKDISYVEELRMYHSCVDCRFLEQCQSDADIEDIQFDYLVCEEFKEV